ncbi:zinc ribbon domain-containing protein [bacterium]|nr:zinc ribbon domain-containing protein [bacterium]
MPNYAFKCEKCDHEFELFLKMSESDNPLKEKCPSCGKKKVVKNWETQRNSIAYDMTLTPTKVCGGAWREVIDRIKTNGMVPKRYHDRLDNAGKGVGRIVR